MPPETRILGLGWHLPEETVSNDDLAGALGLPAGEIASRTGVTVRHRAPDGEGPSDLARRAALAALDAAGCAVSDMGLVVFATATPDVTFPGAACFLQEKLHAGTLGAIDVRAQSAGFLCALDLAMQLGATPSPSGGLDPRYDRVLVAAGEVLTSGLEYAPRGADMTPRFGDGAAAAVVGRGSAGARVGAVRWYTEGDLADRFWCEYPASRQAPVRMTVRDFEEGRHYPRADLGALAEIAVDRLSSVAQEVLEIAGWEPGSLDAAVIDYVEPEVAVRAAHAIGVPDGRASIPTGDFGHVMAAGLPIGLARVLPGLAPGARVLLAAAGPGFTWGAATLEV